MALFFEFLAAQWMLVGALLVCIFLLVKHESSRGGPTLSPQQLVIKVNAEQAAVIDLRDAKEYKAGHIVDAQNIPYAQLSNKLSELEPFRERPIILVCKMGQHSGPAGKMLKARGFDNIFRLSGGMMEWNSSQMPLVNA